MGNDKHGVQDNAYLWEKTKGVQFISQILFAKLGGHVVFLYISLYPFCTS